MLEEVKCNLCGANHYEVLFSSSDGEFGDSENFVYTISDDRIVLPPRIVRCSKCGLIYASPRIKAKELYSRYKDMTDEDYLSEEKGRRLSAGTILRRIMKFKRGGRLLDIGCAAGLFLDEARKSGWETHGGWSYHGGPLK